MRRKSANERIDMRTQPQEKYYFELAAFLGGFNSLTSFMLSAAENYAKDIFASLEQEKRILTERDKELLLKMLDDPPEVNTNLKNAMSLISKIYKEHNEQLVQEVDNKFIKDLPQHENRL